MGKFNQVYCILSAINYDKNCFEGKLTWLPQPFNFKTPIQYDH